MLKRTITVLLIFLALFLLVFALQQTLKIPEHIEGAQVFEQLDFKFQNEPDSAYHPVSLPHNWDKSEPDKGGIGIYRAKLFLVNIPKGAIGFYLPKVSMNAEILLNGTSIGSGGSMEDPVARYWNQPLYLILPTGLWKEGDNIVEIKVYGFPNGRSGLGRIFVGQSSKLTPKVENYRLKLMLLDIGSFSINFILGFMLLLWASRTKEIALFYFAIGALISCVAIADSFWIEVPIHRFTWRWLTHLSIAYSVIFYYLFMLRMLQRRLGWFEKIAIAYLAIGSFVLCFASQGQLLPWARWLHLGSLIVIIQLIYLCSISFIKNLNVMHLWLGACMSLVFIFGIMDWIPAILKTTKDTPYLYYIGPVAFSFAVAIGLLSRYVNALELEFKHTRILKESLEEQQKSLDQQHQQIMQLENERVVNEERNRIVRELHDGIGGQLMGALSLSEKKDPVIEKQVRYALDELRVIMDSLDPDSDFLTMLGMFRQRIEADLNRNQISLNWKVDTTPSALKDSPEKSLEAMRIIQEAVTNTIKYANASQITVVVTQSNLSVSDNGQGFQKNNHSGRGMKNMQWRSEKIQAQFKLNTSEKGTVIQLYW
ncbi:MAG TPA: hypothetical protein ENJ60_01060 [Aeromonadales bacterium]|nr:hypothetical protein [Aeromonadales bacterium]